MPQLAVVEDAALRALLARVVERGPLMAPVRRGKTALDFQWVTDPDDVVVEYVRTVLPPKKAFLPPRERLLDFRTEPQPQASPVVEDTPFVLFGVHPCDLAAINLLDWAMAQRHGMKDPQYLARRRAATIVAVDCMPDEYCFCPSVGTCWTRTGADLLLTPVTAGYYAEALTEKGRALLKMAPERRDPSPEEAREAQMHPEEKVRRITARIDAEPAELPDLLESRYFSAVFEETAARCYSCGTCTNVCPTCFCFDVDDEVNFPLTVGVRGRTYDSCQFLDFALVAGPHNFRAERADRVRHRWFRKFVYLLREHGTPFCVGCGRCTQACTADISLTDVINALLAEAREGVTT